MVKNRQLEALSLTYKVEEKKFLEAKQRIDAVIEERQNLVNALLEQQRELTEKLAEARTRMRAAALTAGDGAQLASISRFEKSLQEQISNLSGNLEEKSKELMQAVERGSIANQELVDARIETKRLERYRENQEQSKRLLDAAVSEAAADDMNFFRKK